MWQCQQARLVFFCLLALATVGAASEGGGGGVEVGVGEGRDWATGGLVAMGLEATGLRGGAISTRAFKSSCATSMGQELR